MNILKKPIFRIILSTIIIAGIGTLWHFLYELLGKPIALAWLFPVSESVWEHLKMTLWPILLVWLVLRSYISASNHPDIHKTFLCIISSTWIAEYVILSIHYILQSGFLLEHVAIDIIAYVIGIFAGQLVSVIYLLPFDLPKWIYRIGYIALALSILTMSVCSYVPPDYPIFANPEA